MKHYKAPTPDSWSGRVDDPSEPRSYRIHQSISMLDMREAVLPRTEDRSFVLLGFCSDEGIRRNQGRIGAAQGPAHIRKALGPLPWDTQVHIYDAGDVTCEDGDLEGAQATLAQISARLLDHGYLTLVMGGGHDVALGHFNGFKEHIADQKGESWGIVNIDAHFDLRPVRGSGNSGTMFSQIAEQSAILGEEFKYLVLGIQSSGNTKLLFDRADELGVKYLLATELYDESTQSLAYISEYMERCDHVYLTLCSDVFSTSHVPGVSAPQALGLAPQRVLSLLAHVISSGKVRCMDIAEVSPPYDHDERSSRVAALMFHEVMQLLNTTLSP